jgi:hypothetical protein
MTTVIKCSDATKDAAKEPPGLAVELGITEEQLLCIKSARAFGALMPLYENSTDARIQQLSDFGYCLFESVLNPEEVQIYTNGFDREMRELGFVSQFANPATTKLCKNFPGSFWTIDTVALALRPTAVSLRVKMREALARALGVRPSTLASSFDGVMCAASNAAGKMGPLPCTDDGQPLEMPVSNCDTGGPTHIDQKPTREATAESHQCYLTLSKADAQDFSTLLFVPTEGWTIQGVRSVLQLKFPEFYDKKRKRDQGAAMLGEEGARPPKEHCAFLQAHGICKPFKPRMKPGDMLVWSSAMFHCGGCLQVPGVERVPRLGIISAYAPKELVDARATATRKKCVGAGYATGQQVIYPSKHNFTVPPCARKSHEALPVPYLRVKEWRFSLKHAPLWQDRDDDDDAAREYRAALRDLLF